MAGSAAARDTLRTLIAPVLGILAWLVVGKTGLGLLALVVAAVLIANVLAAVHHAEVIALRVGEPYGTLVLALAVTVIEAGLIVSMMLSGDPNPTLMRDSIHAVVILVLHGLAGLCIVVGAVHYRQSEFQVEGANAFLAVLIPMAVLVLVAPTYMVSVPGPYYSPLQLAFVSLACLGLYLAFLFIQTNWHRDFFLPVGDDSESNTHARPSPTRAGVSFGVLLVALFSVVMLAKALAPALDEAIDALGAPVALNGVIVAAIVLMPESLSALRAARANRLQSSINLALGSAIASIALTVPVVALVTWWVGQPLTLGIAPGAALLMMLGFLVAMLTYGTGRTNLLSGLVHLVLLATYVFSIFAP